MILQQGRRSSAAYINESDVDLLRNSWHYMCSAVAFEILRAFKKLLCHPVPTNSIVDPARMTCLTMYRPHFRLCYQRAQTTSKIKHQPMLPELRYAGAAWKKGLATPAARTTLVLRISLLFHFGSYE